MIERPCQARDHEPLTCGGTILRGKTVEEDFDRRSCVGKRDVVQQVVLGRRHRDESLRAYPLAHLAGRAEEPILVSLGHAIGPSEGRARSAEVASERRGDRSGQGERAGARDNPVEQHGFPNTREAWIRFFLPEANTFPAMAGNTLEYGIAAPGYRLPAATHVGKVKLQVSDLSQSLAYYRDLLGLRVLEQDAGSAALGAVGRDDALIELHERRDAKAVPRKGLLGLYHFAILLPDLASLGRLLVHLAQHGVQPGMSDHLVSEALYLQDPDNLGIEVYADRPRSSWRHESGQLVMTTIPLDVGAVAAAGGGQPWQGMPAGTTIGHMHLHVGDIERAESFYHAALGLDKVVWSYPGALFLSAGGYHHHLGTNTWARGAPSASDDDTRLLEWELVVPTSSDVDAAAASLTSASYAVVRHDEGLVVKDPWGTQLRVRSQ